jgi:hypothetical protein
MGNRYHCCLGILLPSKSSQHNVLFTVRVSPLGYPFVRHGTNASCFLSAVRDDRKGRKIHAETIHMVDTTADGARADCDVLCVLTYGG